MSRIDIKNDFGFYPNEHYFSLLIKAAQFNSPIVKDAVMKFFKYQGGVSFMTLVPKRSEYTGVLMAYQRMKEAHLIFMHAHRHLSSSAHLRVDELVLPEKNKVYLSLVLDFTNFKKANSLAMMEKYFFSRTKVSLRSCLLDGAAYSIAHASKNRVMVTHQLFVQASEQLSVILSGDSADDVNVETHEAAS
jgi:hypothetical protein